MPLASLHAEDASLARAETLPLGERLHYKIKWLGISVATADVWVEEKIQLNGREVYHIVARLDTNSFLSKIFPMHQELQSWIDAGTLESVQFERNLTGLVKRHEIMTFDGKKKKGYFESYKTGKKNEFDLTAPVHDFLSVLSLARRQKFSLEEPVNVVITCDQKDWALNLHMTKKEKLKYDGKETETLLLEPIAVVEGVEKRGRAWINLSDDESKKPLKFIFKAPFGYVVGTLKEPKS